MKLIQTIWIATCILYFALPVAAAGTGEQARLLEGLRSGEEARLVEARQLLPLAGTDVLEPVLDLLGHENEHVWRAARNILADIANATAAVGYEEENRFVSRTLVRRLGLTDSAQLQEQIMRLLPLSAREDTDLGPVAAILQSEDAVMKEKARACLIEIRTTHAATVLAEALEAAPPEFRVALLDGLARVKSDATLDAIAQRTADADPAVRVAAARALAWSGDPAYRDTVKGTVDQATPSTKEDAWHACLVYAHAMGQRGGSWQTTLALFDTVLREADSTALRGAAVAGLGRYGDDDTVRRIAEIVTSEGGENLEGPALEAFRAQNSRAGRAALAEAYPAFSPTLRANVLRLLGDLGHPEAVEQFYALEPQEGNPLTREAAVTALAATKSPAALPLMQTYLAEADEERKTRAVDTLMQLANAYEKQGLHETAGDAYFLAYRNTEDEWVQKASLDGVKRNPVPAAADLILDELDRADLGSYPMSTLIAFRDAFERQERHEEARRLDDALQQQLTHTAKVQEVIDLANRTGTQDVWEGQLGFLPKWHVLGPLPNPTTKDVAWADVPFDPASVDLTATFGESDDQRQWQAHTGGGLSCMVNLMGIFGAVDNARAFAYTTVSSAEDREATLRIGSDDGVRVWVNGAVVHENPVDRGAVLDQDQIPVKLKAGENTILLEVIQNMGGWCYMARLTTPDGTPLSLN